MGKANIVHTKTVDRIISAIGFAKISGDISMIYGEAGLGKSVALKEYIGTHSDALYVELMNCDKSTKGVCERLIDCMGLCAYGSDRNLIKSIIEYQERHHKIIILDEAQHLSINALENLRSINDKTCTGIVICGNPTVYDRMHGKGQAHFAQLYSRIGIRLEVTPPGIDEMESIYGKIVTDRESLLFLHKLALSHGGLRNCEKVVKIAQQFKEDEKEPLNIELLRSANQIRNGNQ